MLVFDKDNLNKWGKSCFQMMILFIEVKVIYAKRKSNPPIFVKLIYYSS